MPIDPARANAVLDNIEAERAQRARAASLADTIDPAVVGEAMDIGQRRGLPPAVVGADLPGFRETERLDAIDGAARRDPAMADWLSVPEHSKAVKTEEVPLLERFSESARRMLFAGYFSENPLRDVADVGRAVGSGIPQLLAGTIGGTGELYRTVERSLIERPIDALFGTNLQGQAHTYWNNPGEALIQMGRDWRVVEGFVAPPEERQNLATDIGAGVGQLGGQVAQAYVAPQTLVPSLFAQGSDQMAQRARETGDYGSDAGDLATLLGGGITAATEKVGLDLLLRRVPPTIRNEVMRRVADTAIGGAGEAGQEIAEGLLQDVLTRAVLDPEFEIGQGVLREAQAAGGAGAIVRGIVQLVAHRRSAAHAQQGREALDTLVADAKASTMRTNAPMAFQNLVERQAPGATVFVPTKALVGLYQSEKDAAAAIADLTGDPTAWVEANATGGEVAIPLSRYVTHLSDFHDQLKTEVRLVAGQAAAGNDALDDLDPEQVRADIETALAEARSTDARESGALGGIYDQIYGQLIGPQGEVTAAQSAAAVQAFYRTMSQRTGIEPDALWERFPISVNRPLTPTGPRARGIDVTIDPLIDAALAGRPSFTDTEVYGSSLIPAIVAHGGINPEKVGGGDLRAQDAQTRPGLLSLTGLTPEAMAQALAEDPAWRDVFTTKDEFGRPDYRELLELIQRELGGDNVYPLPTSPAEETRRAKREAFLRDTEIVRAAFRSLEGVDPATLDREQLRALAGEALSSSLMQEPAVQVLWHGSPFDFEQFQLGRSQMIFLSDSEEYSALYTGRLDRAPRPVVARVLKPADLDNDPQARAIAIANFNESNFRNTDDGFSPVWNEAEDETWELTESPTFVEAMRAAGYDGAVFTETSSDGTVEGRTWALFDPAQVSFLPAPATLFQAEAAASPFYSALISAVETAKQGRAPAAQWLGLIRNMPGITPGELEYYDVEAWLQAQSGPVTREALLEYLRANELVMHEVLLGTSTANRLWDDVFDNLPFEAAVDEAGNWNVRNRETGAWMYLDASFLSGEETGDAEGDAQKAALDFSRGFLRARQGIDVPQLAGDYGVFRITKQDATDYGVTDNQVGAFGLFDVDRTMGEGMKGDFLGELNANTYARAYLNALRVAAEVSGEPLEEPGAQPGEVAPYANLRLRGPSKNYRVLLMQLPMPDETEARAAYNAAERALFEAGEREGGSSAEVIKQLRRELYDAETHLRRVRAQAYTGGHWGQHPNVIAHMRFDERVDADGKRVLVVHEIQSDWHQEGRRKGYRDESAMTEAQYQQSVQARSDAYSQARFAILAYMTDNQGPWKDRATWVDPGEFLESMDNDDEARFEADPDLRTDEGFLSLWRTYINALDELRTFAANSRPEDQSRKVPDAPFKTTWPELAFKRLLRYAAENGYDRVAWPTAEQVPEIEGWGMSLSEIESMPDLQKRFAAILERYRTDIPRIAKRLANKYGGRVGVAQIGSAPREEDFADLAWSAFTDMLVPRVTLAYQNTAPGMTPAEISEAVEDVVEFLHSTVTMSVGGAAAEDFEEGDPEGPQRTTIGQIQEQLGRWIDSLEFVDEEPGDLPFAFGSDAVGREVMGEIELTLQDVDWDAVRRQGLARNPDATTQMPSLQITDEMRAKVMRGLPLFQGERGMVTFDRGKRGAAREFNVTLLSGADRSTFLHESGHVFLEILGDLAQDQGASAQLVQDFDEALRFIGAPGSGPAERLAWWNASSLEDLREGHERWARGFEAYLREGKPPSHALAGPFARFKVWLMRLYRTLSSLKVELTDEVRGVFDRMLATDAEIAEAREQQYQEALISDGLAIGMDADAFAAYNEAVELARADAEAALAAEVLTAEERAQAAMRSEERRRVRAEVERHTRGLPAYRALLFLRAGKLPDGTSVPEAERFKLSKEALLDDYGPSFLKNLRGTYSAVGGETPETAALALGFGSGRELIEAMVNAPPMQQVIKADTDEIMRQWYPDPLVDGTLPERAMVAAHRERQAETMLLEVQALERHTEGRVRSQAGVLQEAARRLVADKLIRQLHPNTYRAGEAAAGKEAFAAAAKQDWPVALAARRRQLLNHLMYAEAVKARDEAEAAQKFLRAYTKPKRRAALGKAGHDYLEQVDGLLERFDLKKVSNVAAARRSRLADWIRGKQADGIAVELPPAVMDEAFSVPFQNLTIQQARDLKDAVAHIAHLARMKNRLLLKGRLVDRAKVDEAMAASVNQGRSGGRPPRGAPRARDRMRASLLQARGLTATASDLARELDGFRDGGAVWRNTVGVIRDAINNQVTPRLNDVSDRLAKLWLGHYSRAELRDLEKAIYVPALDESWTRSQILSLALNWGNEGNREAILFQAYDRLSPEQVGALLNTLSERDWRFVQEVWDLIDSFWPEIEAAQRRRTGLAPAKVPAAPFSVVTAEGTTLQIRGGYYPLKYAADSAKGRRQAIDEFYKSVQTGQTAKAATRNGHTIERVGSGGATVRLELGVLDQHLRDVVRDLHLGDAVNYVHQALRGPEFSAAVDKAGLVELETALEVWLKDVAAGEMGLRMDFETWLRALRSNLTASVLTYKFTSAALQVTGVLQSAVVLGRKNMLRGVFRYAQGPLAAARYVDEASAFMKQRNQSHVEAVLELTNARMPAWKAGRLAMIRWGYWMMARVQRQVDLTTWLAAEELGLERNNNDVAKARAYADDVVARAQASQDFIDKNALQRGTLGANNRQSELIAATTQLMSYMMAKVNVAYDRTRVTDFKSFGQSARWAMDMVSLFTLEGVLVAIVRAGLPEDDDEEDNLFERSGTVVDDWVGLVTVETLGSLLGGVPGLAQMFSELRGYDAKGTVARAWQAVGRAVEQAKQGELDAAAIKSGVNVAGVVTGAPSSQINKTISAIDAKRKGDDVHPYHYLSGPPAE